MARDGKLNVRKIETTREPGLYSDGGGLFLQVRHADSKSWIFRYTLRGRRRDMGLGSASDFALAEARQKARECRQLLHDRVDPIEHRTAQRAQSAVDASKAVTFRSAAEQYIRAFEGEWRSAKHAAQWSSTLNAYAYPTLGKLAVGAVDVGHVLKVLEPIWKEKPETASRVRGRIESILDWATARKLRAGENPARWRGHLEHLLARKSKIAPVKHHAALPYDEAAAFLVDLTGQAGMAARALEFAILTAARTGEVLGALWGEIDLAQRVWVVPASRMKGGREHRVPLSGRAIAVLEAVKKDSENDVVFSSVGRGKPMSNMAMLVLLRRMSRGDLTAHGFRSTFRDWAGERTNFGDDVAEAALAHIKGDKTEAAYARGDLFEKRRRLMDAWAEFCGATAVTTGDVVPLRSASL